jgi:hypothetical protein
MTHQLQAIYFNVVSNYAERRHTGILKTEEASFKHRSVENRFFETGG